MFSSTNVLGWVSGIKKHELNFMYSKARIGKDVLQFGTDVLGIE
jgi:hypothetical protein